MVDRRYRSVLCESSRSPKQVTDRRKNRWMCRQFHGDCRIQFSLSIELRRIVFSWQCYPLQWHWGSQISSRGSFRAATRHRDEYPPSTTHLLDSLSFRIGAPCKQPPPPLFFFPHVTPCFKLQSRSRLEADCGDHWVVVDWSHCLPFVLFLHPWSLRTWSTAQLPIEKS